MAAIPKAPLRALFASLADLPETQVIWEGEPVPFGQPAVLTLDVLTLRPVGFDDETREYPTPDTTKITSRGQRVLTMSVRLDMYVQEKEAYDVLEDVRLGLGSDEIRELFNEEDLAFTEGTDIQRLPSTVDNRAYSRAQFDIVCNMAVTREKTFNTAGYIEHVEMTGAPELESAGTFEVHTSPWQAP